MAFRTTICSSVMPWGLSRPGITEWYQGKIRSRRPHPLERGLDRHLPRHWTQRGLSWGWTAVIWLAYILTEGDHRKVSVETYLKGMHHTLSRLTAQVIEPLDLSDDRLSHLLKHLSKPAYWHALERDLNARSIAVYALAQDVIRCDATTVSGDHEVTAEGLVQFGHS